MKSFTKFNISCALEFLIEIFRSAVHPTSYNSIAARKKKTLEQNARMTNQCRVKNIVGD